MPSYVLVACRVIKDLWENHRPRRGSATLMVELPGQVTVRLHGELKSSRCTKHKSWFQIRVDREDSGEGIVFATCNEEAIRFNFGFRDRAAGMNIVNCFERPEIAWDCLKGVLQVSPVDLFVVGRPEWADVPAPTPLQFLTSNNIGPKAYANVYSDSASMTSVPIDLSPPPMPEYMRALAMNAERMEPLPIVPGDSTLITDIKMLIRSYVFGTPEQMTPTAAIIHYGGAFHHGMKRLFSIDRPSPEDLAVLDVDWQTGAVLEVRRPSSFDGNRIVATKQIAIMSDPTYNALPVEHSVRVLRKEIIRASDIMEFVMRMEEENRPRTMAVGTFPGAADASHIFLECIECVPVVTRDGQILTTEGIIKEVWRCFWGS